MNRLSDWIFIQALTVAAFAVVYAISVVVIVGGRR